MVWSQREEMLPVVHARERGGCWTVGGEWGGCWTPGGEVWHVKENFFDCPCKGNKVAIREQKKGGREGGRCGTRMKVDWGERRGARNAYAGLG